MRKVKVSDWGGKLVNNGCALLPVIAALSLPSLPVDLVTALRNIKLQSKFHFLHSSLWRIHLEFHNFVFLSQ